MHSVKLGHLRRLDSKWTLPSCTADAEQQTDAAAVCVPIAGDRLTGFSNFRIVLSRAAVDGWVEQDSPCCGAASVAGAWNAVRPAGRASI